MAAEASSHPINAAEQLTEQEAYELAEELKLKLAEQIVDNTKGLNYNFQLIFVDDGSTDNTWQNIQNLPFDNISGIIIVLIS